MWVTLFRNATSSYDNTLAPPIWQYVSPPNWLREGYCMHLIHLCQHSADSTRALIVECQTPGAGWDGGCRAPPSNRSLGITRRPVPKKHK